MASPLNRPKRPVFKRAWFQLLAWGLVLFFITERVMVETQNPNFIPTVIMLGAFLVPVVFVAYVYEKSSGSIPLPEIALCFLVGGILGVLSASVLEYQIRLSLGRLPMLGVGLAEETSKMIFPLVLYWRRRYLSEMQGIAFGVASGMGFAALETMGYGLVSLMASKGDFGTLQETLFIRGLLSPAGHAAWTGFTCAVLWKSRLDSGGQNRLTMAATGAFALAIVLHALWDALQSVPTSTFAGFLIILLLSLAVALISLGLLVFRIHRATHVEPPPFEPESSPSG